MRSMKDDDHGVHVGVAGSPLSGFPMLAREIVAGDRRKARRSLMLASGFRQRACLFFRAQCRWVLEKQGAFVALGRGGEEGHGPESSRGLAHFLFFFCLSLQPSGLCLLLARERGDGPCVAEASPSGLCPFFFLFLFLFLFCFNSNLNLNSNSKLIWPSLANRASHI